MIAMSARTDQLTDRDEQPEKDVEEEEEGDEDDVGPKRRDEED